MQLRSPSSAWRRSEDAYAKWRSFRQSKERVLLRMQLSQTPPADTARKRGNHSRRGDDSTRALPAIRDRHPTKSRETAHSMRSPNQDLLLAKSKGQLRRTAAIPIPNVGGGTS